MLKFKKNGIFSRSASEEATASELQEGGVVAVWGSPGSGKTTMAVKIAKYLADKKRNVVLLLCDMTAPMLPCICPASELECERSLGSVLAAAHVTENLVKNNLITHKRLGYSSFAILKASVILLGIIPCLLVLPMLAPVILFLGIAVYFKEIRRADERLGEKRGEVEAELPRFVATITQELAASRDVLSMVESYKRNAGQTFAAELDILTADMRSGSYEAALTRFEARFNSPLLSDIIRGLIGVLRGDNGVAYFQMLSHDMKQLELQRLKAQAMKIPPKIRVFSFLMLMCFLMTYLAIIVYEIITSLGGMF